jgi:hypothetical protein
MRGKKRTGMQIMCIVIMMMEVIRMMKVLMWRSQCGMLHLMCCYNVETKVSIILRHLIKRRENFFMRSVKGAIRSIQCCG